MTLHPGHAALERGLQNGNRRVLSGGDAARSSRLLAELVQVGQFGLGNFVGFPGSDRYDIKLDTTVPGRESPVRVNFTYQHL